MDRKRRKKCLVSLVCIISILFLTVALPRIEPPEIIIHNHTPSIPVGYYLELPAGKVTDGQIVGFDIHPSLRSYLVSQGWMLEKDTMMKIVGATEGETYEITENLAFYVNGKYIGQVQEKTGNGEVLSHLKVGKYTVPSGEFLPISMNPFAYDGRYFGTVPVSDIRFHAIKIFPIGE